MKPYFEGWYHKLQKGGDAVAFIQGVAADGAFIQVISRDGSRRFSYPKEAYRRYGDTVIVGRSVFSPWGMRLRVNDGLWGDVAYGNSTTTRGGIMGPLRWLPLECRHGVVSLRHVLDGGLHMDGRAVDFTGGAGYIESDRGVSFPHSYFWVSCSDLPGGGAVMAAVADVPVGPLSFRGCVAAVAAAGGGAQERQYRLATYSGARIERCDARGIRLRQGRRVLEVGLLPWRGHPLAAPAGGEMRRTITECIACRGRVRFTDGERVTIDAVSKNISVEYMP
ncbi:MAG: hypothetical protein FWF49_03220 [Oscillospiraceae bacterium]|nr:hypothetical protein [Oscillospiraceae bacterium]